MHSLRMHKVQSVSIAVSVMLSVMILVTFGLVYGGVMQGVDTSEKRGGADVMAIPSDSLQYVEDTELLYTGAPAPIYMDAAVVDKVSEATGVEHVTAQFYSQTLSQACCSATDATRVIGIDTQTDFVVRSLLDEDVVSSLDEHSIILGSRVSGVYDGVFKILGEGYNVIGTMAETGTEFDASIVMDIDLAREMSRQIEGYDHYWEKYGDPANLVSCVMVDLADTDDEAEADAALTSVNAKINLAGATPLVRSEVVDKSQDQLKSVFLLLAVAAGLMMVVTLLQLFARFYSSVWDRRSELALYRAIGASRSDLKKLIFGEMGVLVGGGLVVGIILGFVAQGALLGVLQDGLSFPFLALSPLNSVLLIVGIIAVFAIICFISIATPLGQIGRLDPSTTMQQGDID